MSMPEAGGDNQFKIGYDLILKSKNNLGLREQVIGTLKRMQQSFLDKYPGLGLWECRLDLGLMGERYIHHLESTVQNHQGIGPCGVILPDASKRITLAEAVLLSPLYQTKDLSLKFGGMSCMHDSETGLVVPVAFVSLNNRRNTFFLTEDDLAQFPEFKAIDF